MVLTLTITKMPPGQAPSMQTLDVGPMGCFIGRGADNDWVLPDPDRFLSSKHCQISADGAGFSITDTSTNGVFLNGAAEPLGRGMSSPLKEGDSFDLGDYRFTVSMQNAGASVPTDDPMADPFASPSPFDDGDDFLASAQSHAPLGADDSSLFGGSVGFEDDLAAPAGEGDLLDPLAALDGISGAGGSGRDPLQPPPATLANDFPGGDLNVGSQQAGGDVLSDAASWPDAKADTGMLPDDWDDDLSLLGAAKKPQRQPFALPDDDSLIVSKSKVPQAPPARPAEPASPRARPNPGRATAAQVSNRVASNPASAKPATPRPTPDRRRAPSPPPLAPSRTPSTSSAGGGRHFVDALGFEEQALSDEQITEIEAMTAQMVRETIEGLMQILRSRSSIKNEFRMNVTTIQPIENNPLKFSANVDEVLEIMFLRNKNRSYKEPLEAVRESFQTIADHQVAVIAGIRSAFRSMMARFDPGMLEETFKQNGKGGLLPNVVSGKFWSAYQDHYQSVVNNMESSFQELFGDEFVQAYEDQLRKLSDARRRSQ